MNVSYPGNSPGGRRSSEPSGAFVSCAMDRKKDYFWINDMVPRMIIHPYRTDLEVKFFFKG
jgi:hypothetical protein